MRKFMVPFLILLACAPYVLAFNTFEGIPTGENATFAGMTLTTTPLNLASGGSNKGLIASNGGLIYSDADSLEVLAGTATAGQVLRSGVSSAPSWSTTTYPATIGAGDILGGTALNVIGAITDLPTATTIGSAYVYRAGGTDVAQTDGGLGGDMTAATDGQIPIGDTGVGLVLATITGTAGEWEVTNGAGTITGGIPDAPTFTGPVTDTLDDANNATVTALLSLTHTTSGVPGVGIGTGLNFVAETSAGNNEIGSSIQSVATNVGAGTEAFDIVFRNMVGGAAATEGMRLTSDRQLQFSDGTDMGLIKQVQEAGLGGRLTIGLDETARTLLLCDAGDIDVDMGLPVATSPSLVITHATPGFANSAVYSYRGLTFSGLMDNTVGTQIVYALTTDIASGDSIKFYSQFTGGGELTDTDGEQSFLNLSPNVNQSGTAGYNGLKILARENAVGSGATGTGGTNNLVALGTVADPDMVMIQNNGTIRQTVGLNVWAPQALTVTTEANITLTGAMLLITGDDDADNDTIDLQNGTYAGQQLQVHATALIDADDTISIAYTDTTCTNCPAITLDKIGENAVLGWTGTTWFVMSLQTAL